MRQTMRKIIKWLTDFLRNYFHQQNEHFPYYLTILLSFILFVVCLNFFVEITEGLRENELVPYDDYFTAKIQAFQTPGLTNFFLVATHLGDRAAYVIFTAAIALFFFLKDKRWKFAVQASLVLILSSLSNVALKRVIQRERPTLEHLVAVNSLSYPSGHAMSAMAFYGFLSYLCLRSGRSLGFKISCITVLVLLILLIGISRIYLGVHFPSDVLAGYIGGLIWVTFCAILFNVLELYQNQKHKLE